MSIRTFQNAFINRSKLKCLPTLLFSGLYTIWRRMCMIVLVLTIFFYFVFFGIADEKMMLKNFRMPAPYSIIPLYPSRVPLLDLPHFKYIINNDVCGKSKIFAVAIVHSHPANKDLRDAMRKNIPAEDLEDIGMRRVFLLARAEWNDQLSYSFTPQNEISEENVIHRDIIQGNFKEHYHNLTYKHVMGLNWVNTFCSQVKYIIKMDDDIIVDLYNFRDLLKYRYSDRRNLILGLLLAESRVMRDPKSKWYVSKRDYSREVYPNFVSGWAYAMSSDAARAIVNVSQKIPYFWIDDVHVTGTLAELAGVKREGLNRLYTIHTYHLRCCVELPKHADYYCDFIVGPSENDVALMEKLLRHARSCFVQPCLKRPRHISVAKMCIRTEDSNNIDKGKGKGEVIIIT